jgi:pimeloyl-ACP methyl ester carboxylesterase
VSRHQVGTADNDGVTIAYDDHGPSDAPAVLFVHGWPDSAGLWRHQIGPLVDAGYRVIAMDQRGYGRSDKPDDMGAYHALVLASDAGAVLDAAGVTSARVVGHDWGAVTVWLLAIMSPDRVDQLVTLSVGHPRAFAAAGLAQREKSWYTLLFQFEGVAERWLSDDGWAHMKEWANHPDHDEVVARLEADGSLTPGLNVYRATTPPSSLVDPPLVLPPVQAPTMGIWSSGDMALLEEQMTGSAAYCANGFRYERIDDVGHWIPLEAPDALNGLLLDFFGSAPS